MRVQMAPTPALILESVACPYLGLPKDARTRFSFPTPAHRCHARKSSSISLDHQRVYCMTSRFPACKRYPRSKTSVAAIADREKSAPASRAELTRAPNVRSSPSVMSPSVAIVSSSSRRSTPSDLPKTTKMSRGGEVRALVESVMLLVAQGRRPTHRRDQDRNGPRSETRR